MRKLLCPECGGEVMGGNDEDTWCPRCGVPLTLFGIKFARKGSHSRDNYLDFVIRIRGYISTEISEPLRQEIAAAAAFAVDHSFPGFPLLTKAAELSGLLCPLDGRLHYRKNCLERLEQTYRAILAEPDRHEALVIEEARRYLNERTNNKA